MCVACTLLDALHVHRWLRRLVVLPPSVKWWHTTWRAIWSQYNCWHFETKSHTYTVGQFTFSSFHCNTQSLLHWPLLALNEHIDHSTAKFSFFSVALLWDVSFKHGEKLEEFQHNMSLAISLVLVMSEWTLAYPTIFTTCELSWITTLG